MVKKWIKQLDSIKTVSNINFDRIILDILEGNYSSYDVIGLSGYSGLYRLIIGGYRIIFSKINGDIKVLFLGKRGDVYNWLKNLK